MKFYRILAISLLLTVCVACATNANTNETSNVTKAATSTKADTSNTEMVLINKEVQQPTKTDTDTEQVLVSKEVQRLAKTDISNKELGEKLVCKTVQKTGSRFKSKVCRTKKEVINERVAAQEEIDKIRRSTPITSN